VKTFVVLGIVFAVLAIVLSGAAIIWYMVNPDPRTPFDGDTLKIDLKAGVTYDINQVISGKISKTASCTVADSNDVSKTMNNNHPVVFGSGSGEHDFNLYSFTPSTSGQHTFVCTHASGTSGGSFYLTSAEDESLVPVVLIGVSLLVCVPIALLMFSVALVTWLVTRSSPRPVAPPTWDIQDAPE
ncbi:MAG: hypothetical protein FWD11_04220, partial [Micrococcales bacterium]|nr:hypothetical protein [Micrococcales bacterium]